MGRPDKDYNDGQTLSTVIASRSSAHPTLQRALHEVDPQFFGPGLGQRFTVVLTLTIMSGAEYALHVLILNFRPTGITNGVRDGSAADLLRACAKCRQRLWSVGWPQNPPALAATAARAGARALGIEIASAREG